MSGRPRRSAAQKASVAITDLADRDNMSSSRPRRAADSKGLASVSRGAQDERDHTYLTVKLPASKLRQATSSKNGSSIAVNNDSTPKRSTRGNKKSYIVDDSDSNEQDDDEGEDEIQVGAPGADMDEDVDDDDDDDDEMDDDADGDVVEDEMDLDAEGDEDDEDAEGEEDVEMTPAQPAPTIKINKAAKTSPSLKKTKQATPKKAAGQPAISADDSDDDELSDLDSDDEAMNVGDEDAEGEEDDEEMDAEGDDLDAEGEPEGEIGPGAEDVDSDDDADSRGETPDLSKMTMRQRARLERLDESHYQALSNEVQAKKHFTVEEKAMRRAEMARRRRNLSEKRSEEVKQETINKLLKKQAGKTNRKGLQAIGEEGQDEDDSRKPNPIFIRWISSREGNRIAVPGEIIEGPAGRVFANTARPSAAGLGGPRKMVEEVS